MSQGPEPPLLDPPLDPLLLLDPPPPLDPPPLLPPLDEPLVPASFDPPLPLPASLNPPLDPASNAPPLPLPLLEDPLLPLLEDPLLPLLEDPLLLPLLEDAPPLLPPMEASGAAASSERQDAESSIHPSAMMGIRHPGNEECIVTPQANGRTGPGP
jgi:hypothetical protein